MKFFLAMLLTTTVLLGASWDFRGGKILCAELSFTKPAVPGTLLQAQKNLPAKPVFAALTILCDDGRRLSVHDYGIEAGGIYPCVAIKKERTAFSAAGTEGRMADPKARYTLLFVLDAAYVGLKFSVTFLVRVSALSQRNPTSATNPKKISFVSPFCKQKFWKPIPLI